MTANRGVRADHLDEPLMAPWMWGSNTLRAAVFTRQFRAATVSGPNVMRLPDSVLRT